MLYYLAIAVFGYIGYKTWEDEMNVIIIHGFYNLTKAYHIMNDYLYVEKLEDDKQEEKKIKKTLLEIRNSNQEILNFEITKEVFLEKIKKNTLILKVNDNHKILKDTDYENINKINEIELEKDKLFLQVMYIDDNNEIEIQNKINFFVVEGNEILSESFLLWFMKQYYNVDIYNCNDYKIKIIDNDVNMFDVKKGVKILIKNNTYSLLNE